MRVHFIFSTVLFKITFKKQIEDREILDKLLRLTTYIILSSFVGLFFVRLFQSMKYSYVLRNSFQGC